MSDWLQMSASELAERLLRREFSCVELVQAALTEVDSTHERLNAVVVRCDERALTEAAAADAALNRGDAVGPLHGVPITIKDSHDTEGIVSSGGTLGRCDWIPVADSPPVARLRRAGAIVIGKTNTPELTLAFVTENDVFGRTNHPLDPGRTPGGSSGGAAAILASGGPALELGSDLGGSIRVPAHWCGIYGLKTTRGRVPRTGHILPWGGPLDSYSTIGPMARSVQDLELALSLISGPDGCDPFIPPMPVRSSSEVRVEGMRVGWFEANGVQTPEQSIMDGVRSAVGQLEAAGARSRPVAPEPWVEAWMLASLRFSVDIGPVAAALLQLYGTRQPSAQLELDFADPSVGWLAGMRELLYGLGATRSLSPLLAGVAAGDRERALSRTEYLSLLLETDRVRGQLLAQIADFDVILCPPSACVAPTHEQALQIPQSYGNAVNLSGFPACVVPVGHANGLPLGVQVIAAPWNEHVALKAAAIISDRSG